MGEGGSSKSGDSFTSCRVEDSQIFLLSALKRAPGMVDRKGQHLHNAETQSKQYVS